MHIRPSISLNSLPGRGGYRPRFELAAAAGFEGVEIGCPPSDIAEVREAAEASGLNVHTLYSDSNWRHPLSSGSREGLATGVKETVAAIETAHALGAGTVLLIPGLVDRETSYAQAYARSQAVIRSEILPVAHDLGIILAVENVWNGLLLGPLEYVRYIDEFDSPWVKGLLDLGNIIFGHAEDWIEIAGQRIVQLHLKDFRFNKRWGRYRSLMLGEGEVDWARIRAALTGIGFSGWGTIAGPERARLGTHILYYAAERAPPGLLSSIPGSRPTLEAAHRYVGGRMLADAIGRFRSHVAA
jgi:L-ribulose-5-phosphate 3-epimerase